MIRTLFILAALPFISACGLEDLFRPGSSQARYEYQQAGLIQAPAEPITPRPTQVAEIPVPASVDVPEPVYVAPEPPAQYVPQLPPECTASLYKIYDCIDGKVKLLEW